MLAALIVAAGFCATLGVVRTTLAAPPAGSVRGKTVFESRCVACHGMSGRGDGPAAMLLNPRPRDFASGRFKIRSTETGSVPTDDDLIRSVGQGIAGTAMPAWNGVIAEPDIREVVQYVKAFSPRFASDPPKIVAPGTPIPSSPESIERGRQVFSGQQCTKCHGTDGRGTGAAATSFEDDWGQPLTSGDLTKPWTFHGGATALDIYMRIRTGMSGTPMPAFTDTVTEPQMWDLANFVVSLARKPVWSMDPGDVAAVYAREEVEAKADPLRRGKYLVDTIGCALCHSATDDQKRILPGLKMAGGLRIRIEPFGEYPSGNLTSDKETGLGNWTDEEITSVLTRGVLRDGTRLPPYPMDWPSYSTMTPEDLDAIVRYLRTIPPVSNKVPRPSRPLLPVYLWGKFKMLVLHQDPPMQFYSGNAGSAAAGAR